MRTQHSLAGFLMMDILGDQRTYAVEGLMMEICTETQCLWQDQDDLLMEISELSLCHAISEVEVDSNEGSEFLSSSRPYFDYIEFQKMQSHFW